MFRAYGENLKTSVLRVLSAENEVFHEQEYK